MSLQEILQQLVNGLVTGGIYALIAVGLTMIFGILDIVNFAHGELYMVGAYLTYIFVTQINLPFAVAVAAAVAAAALIGALVEFVIFRPVRFSSPLNSIIVSMGLSIILANGALLIFTATPRALASPVSGSVDLGGVIVTWDRLLIFAVAAGLFVALTLYVRKTWMGTAMRAVAQDLTAAQLVGININRVSRTTFVISVGLAAVAGALVGPLVVLQPSMGGVAVLKAFAVVILGGIGSVPGAIFASLLLGVVEQFTAAFVSNAFKDFISFAILIAVLMIRPTGLFGQQRTV